MTKRVLVFFFLLLAANLAASALLAGDGQWVVREDSVGPVRIYRTLPQMNKVLQEKFSLAANKDDRGCFYVKPEKHPQFAFMIEDGRVTRVDVASPGAKTSEGIQVGDSEEQAKRVYGSRLNV